jgi:hypothetical protein
MLNKLHVQLVGETNWTCHAICKGQGQHPDELANRAQAAKVCNLLSAQLVGQAALARLLCVQWAQRLCHSHAKIPKNRLCHSSTLPFTIGHVTFPAAYTAEQN